MDDESKSPANVSAKGIERNPLSATSDDKSSKQMESSSLAFRQNQKGNDTCIRTSPSKECMHTNQENEVLDSLEAVGIAGNDTGVTG